MAAYETTNDRRQAHNLAIKAMRPLHGSATLVNVNDVRGHAAVLALFDEVGGLSSKLRTDQRAGQGEGYHITILPC